MELSNNSTLNRTRTLPLLDRCPLNIVLALTSPRQGRPRRPDKTQFESGLVAAQNALTGLSVRDSPPQDSIPNRSLPLHEKRWSPILLRVIDVAGVGLQSYIWDRLFARYCFSVEHKRCGLLENFIQEVQTCRIVPAVALQCAHVLVLAGYSIAFSWLHKKLLAFIRRNHSSTPSGVPSVPFMARTSDLLFATLCSPLVLGTWVYNGIVPSPFLIFKKFTSVISDARAAKAQVTIQEAIGITVGTSTYCYLLNAGDQLLEVDEQLADIQGEDWLQVHFEARVDYYSWLLCRCAVGYRRCLDRAACLASPKKPATRRCINGEHISTTTNANSISRQDFDTETLSPALRRILLSAAESVPFLTLGNRLAFIEGRLSTSVVQFAILHPLASMIWPDAISTNAPMPIGRAPDMVFNEAKRWFIGAVPAMALSVAFECLCFTFRSWLQSEGHTQAMDHTDENPTLNLVAA